MAKRTFQIGRGAKVFLLLLGATTLVSVLIKLSKPYTSELVVPLRLMDVPVDQSLQSASSDSLSIQLRQSGFALLANRLGNPVYRVSYKNLQQTPDGTLRLVLNEERIKQAGVFQGEVYQATVYPQEVQLVFDTLSRKRIPIKQKIDVHYKAGFNAIGDLLVEPREVEVIGLQSQLDTIAAIFTKELVLKEVASTVDKQVSLEIPKGLEMTIQEVRVRQEVARFTEADFEIPITLDPKMPKNMEIFPKFVELLCIVPVGEFQNISPNDFTVAIDFNKFEEDREFVDLKVVKKPKTSTNIQLSSRQVRLLKVE